MNVYFTISVLHISQTMKNFYNISKSAQKSRDTH